MQDILATPSSVQVASFVVTGVPATCEQGAGVELLLLLELAGLDELLLELELAGLSGSISPGFTVPPDVSISIGINELYILWFGQ